MCAPAKAYMWRSEDNVRVRSLLPPGGSQGSKSLVHAIYLLCSSISREIGGTHYP